MPDINHAKARELAQNITSSYEWHKAQGTPDDFLNHDFYEVARAYLALPPPRDMRFDIPSDRP